jgi:lysophospholipid acyltransferase (LPLAT)-like uncharacterized protein
MSKKYLVVVKSKPFLSFLYRFIRAYSWTFRLTVENEEAWMDYLKGGGTVLLCAWHQQFFSAIYHFKTYAHQNPSLMISQSNDGEIIAAIANKSGWKTVRGSSSKDGIESLRAMINNLKWYRLAGHIVDGPRGPAGVIKAGVISLAAATNAVIVPFYTSSDQAWYFNSWDRFMLPKPFARVTLRFGAMINFHTEHHEMAFEERRLFLEKVMKPALIEESDHAKSETNKYSVLF